METKTTQFSECQIKSKDSGWRFEGYASKFGGVDSYRDTIIPGAYKKTLSERDKPVFMRFEHMSGGLPPGKWLKATEDSTGLFVEGELTKGQSLASDIKASMEHGTLEGLSIGYRIPAGGAKENDDGIRELSEIDLVEISIVQNPADSAALITGMKAEIETIDSFKEAERFLRDVERFSVSTAKCFVSRIKQLSLREVKKPEDEIAELKAKLNENQSFGRLAQIISNLEV